MTVKLFEVRDRGTTMAMIGIACARVEARSEREILLLERAGYGDRCILLGSLDGGKFAYDPYDQFNGARTRGAAHLYIEENWDSLKSGDIIDVEFILGETPAPKETDL